MQSINHPQQLRKYTVNELPYLSNHVTKIFWLITLFLLFSCFVIPAKKLQQLLTPSSNLFFFKKKKEKAYSILLFCIFTLGSGNLQVGKVKQTTPFPSPPSHTPLYHKAMAVSIPVLLIVCSLHLLAFVFAVGAERRRSTVSNHPLPLPLRFYLIPSL